MQTPSPPALAMAPSPSTSLTASPAPPPSANYFAFTFTVNLTLIPGSKPFAVETALCPFLRKAVQDLFTSKSVSTTEAGNRFHGCSFISNDPASSTMTYASSFLADKRGNGMQAIQDVFSSIQQGLSTQFAQTACLLCGSSTVAVETNSKTIVASLTPANYLHLNSGKGCDGGPPAAPLPPRPPMPPPNPPQPPCSPPGNASPPLSTPVANSPSPSLSPPPPQPEKSSTSIAITFTINITLPHGVDISAVQLRLCVRLRKAAQDLFAIHSVATAQANNRYSGCSAINSYPASNSVAYSSSFLANKRSNAMAAIQTTFSDVQRNAPVKFPQTANLMCGSTTTVVETNSGTMIATLTPANAPLLKQGNGCYLRMP